MDSIKKNLTNIVTLIGLITAIGAGFVKYGEIQEKLNNIAEPFNPDPLVKIIGENQKDIAVLQKTIQVLELEIQELKASKKNPLAN
jgi:hypothetical protein